MSHQDQGELIESLTKQIAQLEARLGHVEHYLQQLTSHQGVAHAEPGTAPTSDVAASTPDMYDKVAPATASHITKKSTGPGLVARFFMWCKEDWLLKLGGFLIILGMAWFVSYAVAKGWIGEFGRIALGLAAGAAVLALGRYRLQRFVTQGTTLMFIGAVIVVMTMFAAQELYDMFPPTLALLVMFGTSCLLGLTSVLHKRPALAYGNVLLAALAPLLINAPELPLVGLFTYLLVLSVGSVWVGAVSGWRLVPFLSFIVVGLYSMERLFDWPQKDLDVGMLFAFVFTALFFGVSVMGMRIAKKTEILDVLTALGAGLFLLMWILGGAEEEWKSLLLIAWTCVFAYGAFFATRLGASVGYFYSYAGVGVVFLAVATAIELDGAALTVALLFEAAFLMALGYRVTGQVRALPALGLPMIVPIILSIESLAAREWRDSVMHEHAFVVVLFIVVVGALGMYFYERQKRVDEKDRTILREAAVILWIGAALYATALVWLVTHALLTGDSGTMMALFIYILVAATFFMMHRASQVHWHRMVAIAYTVFVVGRLLLVEVWDMSRGTRVVTFLIIGVVLVAVAWLERSRTLGPTKAVPSESDTK